MGLTRIVDGDTLAALAGHFCPALLVEVDWPGGAFRGHTGLQALTWGGHTWTPVGDFGRLDLPAEDGGLASKGASLTWIDTPENLLDLLGVDARGRAVRVWFAVVTEPRGNVLVGEPVDLYAGYIDSRSMPVRRDRDRLQTELSFGLGDGVPARSGVAASHTPEDQEAAQTGDTGMRHVIIAQRTAMNPQLW